jgi:hypothetical protein
MQTPTNGHCAKGGGEARGGTDEDGSVGLLLCVFRSCEPLKRPCLNGQANATDLEKHEGDAEEEADGAAELLLAREEEKRLARANDERQAREEENLRAAPSSRRRRCQLSERLMSKDEDKERGCKVGSQLAGEELVSSTGGRTHVAEGEQDAVEEEDDAEQHEQHTDTLRD